MLSRTVLVGALALALSGAAALPAQAEQGRGKQKAHVVKVKDHGKSNRGQGKAKNKVKTNRGAGSWTWTNEQRVRLTPMLPAGLTLEQAAWGFRNQGQFIATLNASRDHNVSFHELKHLMIDRGLSLGQALQAARR